MTPNNPQSQKLIIQVTFHYFPYNNNFLQLLLLLLIHCTFTYSYEKKKKEKFMNRHHVLNLPSTQMIIMNISHILLHPFKYVI